MTLTRVLLESNRKEFIVREIDITMNSTTDLIEPWLHSFQVADVDRQVVRREVARLAELQAEAR